LDFTPRARHEHARRVAEVANILYHAGFVVIVSIVSPYKNDRDYAKDIIGKDRFMEVYMDTPLAACKENNPHGIYTKAERGEIENVPGIDVAYEESEDAHVLANEGMASEIQDLLERIQDDVR
jgi:adenylylsulfate kinase-like enzyme